MRNLRFASLPSRQQIAVMNMNRKRERESFLESLRYPSETLSLLSLI
jgi:hypothetical protein